MAQTIDLTIGSIKTTALAAIPSASRAVPGIVIGFHHWGFDEFTHEMVERLAAEGYAAIAPNHYHVLPPGVGQERRKEFLTDQQITADVEASADWLASRKDVDGDRLAVIGHCMGGRTTLLAMVSLPDRIRCGCMWYGGGMFNRLGSLPPPGERLSELKNPLIGFFGNLDKRPPPEDVDRLETLVTKLEKSCEIHRYDADHSFMWRQGKRYNEHAARDSWTRALGFLDRYLRDC